ncbi:VWA domain-containing protein [soil metagenome]
MTEMKRHVGGIIHTYQKYDPQHFPSPTTPPPDLVSPAMEHLLHHGSMRRFTPEELAKMVKLDATQIMGLMPGLDFLRQKLEDRKRKILETYETKKVTQVAKNGFEQQAKKTTPPKHLQKQFDEAIRDEQIPDLEELYYKAGDDRGAFSRSLVPLIQRLGEKFLIDELAGKYEFTGRTPMTVEEALAIKEELETIDKLLKQLQDAKANASLGYIDLEELQEFMDEAGLEQLQQLQRQINDYLEQQAKEQGLETDGKNQFQMTPKAYRLFQSKVLTRIFAELKASRTGRHSEAVIGDGATESPRTKQYEFGDSVTHMDIPGSFTNALLRNGPGLPVRLSPDDIIVHKTRNTPKAATCVLLDMSGSMRYDAQYANVKRMGLALDGLIRSEYPGDFLQFVEMYTFAKPRPFAEVAELMPKPVTLYDPVVRLKVDMADPRFSELDIPPHFTNIQHALQTARRFLGSQPTPNRNVMLITDGLPTAHFEGSMLYLLYPPDQRTEDATMREAMLCAREGIIINIFLLSTWNQSEEDIRFARRLAETTKGRVIYTTGKELDRFVIWDYIANRKSIVAG